MRTERETIANHEAGHAAMAWLCGFDTEFVDIHLTADRKGGVKLILSEEHLDAADASDVDAVRRRAFVCCAGPAADFRHAHGVGYEDVPGGFNGNRINAESLVARIAEQGIDLFLKYAMFVKVLFDNFE